MDGIRSTIASEILRPVVAVTDAAPPDHLTILSFFLRPRIRTVVVFRMLLVRHCIAVDACGSGRFRWAVGSPSELNQPAWQFYRFVLRSGSCFDRHDHADDRKAAGLSVAAGAVFGCVHRSPCDFDGAEFTADPVLMAAAAAADFVPCDSNQLLGITHAIAVVVWCSNVVLGIKLATGFYKLRFDGPEQN